MRKIVIADVTDSAKYDKMFVECFRKGLYSKLAHLIKEHNKKD